MICLNEESFDSFPLVIIIVNEFQLNMDSAKILEYFEITSVIRSTKKLNEEKSITSDENRNLYLA